MIELNLIFNFEVSIFLKLKKFLREINKINNLRFVIVYIGDICLKYYILLDSDFEYH